MFFISTWLTRPIRLLTKAARKMTDGDYSYRAEQVSRDEMGQLTRDFNHMAGGLEENIHRKCARIHTETGRDAPSFPDTYPSDNRKEPPHPSPAV